MNMIDRRIQDRDTLLALLVSGDRYAAAALARKDDMAVLRRIAKAGITDAWPLAIERAMMRGRGRRDITKALGISPADLNHYIADIYARKADA